MILKIIRWLTVSFLLLLVFIFAVVFGVLFTDRGSKLVWDTAKEYVPMIKGELESGNLASGLNIRDFSLEVDGFRIGIDRLKSSWDMLTLLYGRFDINDLEVDGIRLDLAIPPQSTDSEYDGFFFSKVKTIWNGGDPSVLDRELEQKLLEQTASVNRENEEAKKDPLIIDIPLLINLKKATVKNFTMNSELFVLTGRRMDLSTSLYKHIMTDTVAVGDEWDFELLDLNSPVYPTFPSLKIKDGFDKEEIRSRITTLPPVFIPFEIYIKRLELKNSRYHQSSYDTQKLTAVLHGHIHEYNIDLVRSSIDSEQYGKIGISGHVGLKDNLDLDLHASGDLDYAVTDDLKLKFPFNLKAKGDLTDLDVDLLTADQRAIAVKSRINLIDGNLTNVSEIKYKKLEWPLDAASPDHVLTDGTVSYRGTLTELNLKAGSSVTTSFLPGKKFKFAADVAGTLEDLTVNGLSLSSGENNKLALAAHLLYNGSKVTVQNLDFAIDGKLSNILTDGAVDSLQGQLHSDAVYDLEKNVAEFKLPKLDFSGTVLKYPVKIRAQLDGTVPVDDLMKMDVNVGKLDLDVCRNTVAAGGRISGIRDNDFKLDIKLANPAELTGLFMSQPLEGYLNASASLGGTLMKPVIRMDAATDHLAMGDTFTVNQLTLKVDEKLDVDNLKFSGLTLLKIKKSMAAGREVKNLILKLDGNQELHKFIAWLQLADDQAFAFKETGSFNGKMYRADFDQIELNTPVGNWKQKQKLTLDYDLQKNLLRFSPFNLLNGEQSFVVKQGFFNVADHSSDIHLQFKRFRLEFLNRFMPQDTKIFASVHGNVDITSKPYKNFIVDANIYSKNGSFIGPESGTSFERIDINLKLDEKQMAAAELLINADEFGKFSARTMFDLKTNKVMFGESSVIRFDNFDLGLFNPLANPVETLKAVVNGEGTVNIDQKSGNLYVDGNFDITEGQVVTQLDIANLTNLHFNIKSSHDAVRLDGGFNLGEGQGNLKGDLDLRPMYTGGIPKGNISLLLDSTTVNLMGYGSATVDSRFNMSFRENEKDPENLLMYIKGLIKIPQAKIEVAEIGDSGVSMSSDVEVITSQTPEEKKRNLPQTPTNLLYDINVSVGPMISVKGFGFKGGLVGKLVVSNTRSDNNAMDAHGKISITHGRLRSFGQSLIIRNGEVLFDGLLTNPSIKFDAIRDPETINDNSGTIAGLRVFGTPLKMQLKIFSEPEMSDAEKLSYLLKGTPLSEDGGENSAAAAGMLLGASLGSASNSMQDFTNAIGLKDFQLESTGSGDSSAVQASFYLTRKLKVSYGYGLFDSIMQLKLRYQLMRKLYLQYLNGAEQAVDLFYTFSFD